MPDHYLVRAMDQSAVHYARFFEAERIAVGWSAVDFSKGTPDEVVRRVSAHYYAGADPRYRGIRMAEVQRFLGMTLHDWIVVPVAAGVRLAHVTGPLDYDARAAVDELDLANQRSAQYLRASDGSLLTVPRADLSEGLRRRLRVRGTAVRDLRGLRDFAVELDRLFAGQRPADHAATEQGRIEADFARRLLDAIRQGRTLLAAGGEGVEHLVAELLRADGYSAEVLSKRTFPGFADADVRAVRQDHVGETLLLVQVKHHHGESGTWGTEQLAEIRRQRDDRWADHDLVLVTTARASEALVDHAHQHDVTLLDGEALVAWIADAHHLLSPRSRRALGLSSLPVWYDPVPGNPVSHVPNAAS